MKVTVFEDTRVALQDLADIAVDLVADTRRWGPLVRHDPDERYAYRFHAGPGFDAWVLGWTGGQAVPMHDHGDAHGVICVVEGTLVETRWRHDRLSLDVLDNGVVRGVAAGTVHGVANLHDAPATSIHVYSPALTVMNYFEHGSGELRVTRAAPVNAADVG